MRLISLNLILFVTVFMACDTASNVDPVFETYFTKYYGEDGEQEGIDIVRNADGSMILLGNSFSQSDPISPFIVKTDASGNIIWQREFKNDNETAVDIELVNGGSQIAMVSNVQRSKSIICLYILGQDGNLVDSVLLTNSQNQNQVAKSVVQSSDNGFLITGYKDPDPTRNPGLTRDEADILLLKVNNTLSGVSDKSPGGGENIGSGTKAFEINLNNAIYYLVFGYSDRPREDNSAIYQLCFQLIASNVDGVPLGMHEVSENEKTETQVASSTLKIPAALGDGYLMVGTTSSPGSTDLYLTRFSKPLSPGSAEKTLDRKIAISGRRIEGVSAANALPDGYLIVANEIRENNQKDIFLLRVDRDGAISWMTSFGSLDGNDTAGAVEALPDGRIAVVGTVQLETQKKMVLLMTSPNGGFSD